MLVVILSRSIQINTAELGVHITATRELLRFPQYTGFDLTSVADAAALHSAITQQALMIGYVNVFSLLPWVALAGLPVLLLIPSDKRNRQVLARRTPSSGNPANDTSDKSR